MPQLRDGAYINHVTSNFLNAWKSSSQNEKKTAHAMCRSISFSESKHRNELFFFLQKNMMQGFFHWVKTKRKKKNKKNTFKIHSFETFCFNIFPMCTEALKINSETCWKRIKSNFQVWQYFPHTYTLT